MKKIFNNPIFTFILGSIIFSGIGTVFAYSLTADDTEYLPDDSTWEVNEVQTALNDLRSIANLAYVYGTQKSSSYGNWVAVNVGFKPRMVLGIIPTSGGFLRAFMFINGKTWTGYQRGSQLASSAQGSNLQITDTGFKWRVYDSSWGTQTIYYYAFK